MNATLSDSDSESGDSEGCHQSDENVNFVAFTSSVSSYKESLKSESVKEEGSSKS